MQLPKIKHQYRDGDYYNFLKNSLSREQYSFLETEVKRIRNNNIKFYRRFYTNSSCTNEYISFTSEDRNEIKNTITKILTDEIFTVEYVECEHNYTLKEYIFLQ